MNEARVFFPLRSAHVVGQARVVGKICKLNMDHEQKKRGRNGYVDVREQGTLHRKASEKMQYRTLAHLYLKQDVLRNRTTELLI